MVVGFPTILVVDLETLEICIHLCEKGFSSLAYVFDLEFGEFGPLSFLPRADIFCAFAPYGGDTTLSISTVAFVAEVDGHITSISFSLLSPDILEHGSTNSETMGVDTSYIIGTAYTCRCRVEQLTD